MPSGSDAHREVLLGGKKNNSDMNTASFSLKKWLFHLLGGIATLKYSYPQIVYIYTSINMKERGHLISISHAIIRLKILL